MSQSHFTPILKAVAHSHQLEVLFVGQTLKNSDKYIKVDAIHPEARFCWNLDVVDVDSIISWMP
jgi:hypothetical protein